MANCMSQATQESTAEAQLVIDEARKAVRLGNCAIELTPAEFSLINALASKPGQVFTRAELVPYVSAEGSDTRVVDSHIKNIRLKLRENARSPRWLKTAHGVGYYLDIPASDTNMGPASRGIAFKSASDGGVLIFDEVGHHVNVDGNEIHLTVSEFDTLGSLVRHAGESISQDQLSMEALGVGFLESGRLLASHIKNLRKKLKDEPRRPRWIQTVHGFGYCFVGMHAPEPSEEAPVARVQQEIAEFLAATTGNIVLWHDPEGTFEGVLESLELPPAVCLLIDKGIGAFATKQALNSLAPDERIVLYRRKRHRIEEPDWFSDIEAYADCFVPEDDEESPAPIVEETTWGSGPTSRAQLLDGYRLDADWYTIDGFEAAVHSLNIDPSLYDAEVQPWQLGFRRYEDCVIRNTWRSAPAYYQTLFSTPLVGGELPSELKSCGSFRRFTASSVLSGMFFLYDDGTWITKAGLVELDITHEELDAFARAAAEFYRASDIPQFTLYRLKHDMPSLELFAYELNDCFYESVLASRRSHLETSSLCDVRTFAPAGVPVQGRALVATIVMSEQSLQADDLLDILQADYGIPVTRSQLLQLIRKAELFFSPELDRVFCNRKQFLREVE